MGYLSHLSRQSQQLLTFLLGTNGTTCFVHKTKRHSHQAPEPSETICNYNYQSSGGKGGQSFLALQYFFTTVRLP